jgi:hypothetical protein
LFPRSHLVFGFINSANFGYKFFIPHFDRIWLIILTSTKLNIMSGSILYYLIRTLNCVLCVSCGRINITYIIYDLHVWLDQRFFLSQKYRIWSLLGSPLCLRLLITLLSEQCYRATFVKFFSHLTTFKLLCITLGTN